MVFDHFMLWDRIASKLSSATEILKISVFLLTFFLGNREIAIDGWNSIVVDNFRICSLLYFLQEIDMQFIISVWYVLLQQFWVKMPDVLRLDCMTFMFELFNELICLLYLLDYLTFVKLIFNTFDLL